MQLDIPLLGESKGAGPARITRPVEAKRDELVADIMGFNLHANLALDGRDRPRLERLLRYLTRPPIAQDRLELRADGRVSFTMKEAWRDGTHMLVEPLDLIGRICAMAP